LLGAYSKAEYDAMTTAFGARGKKRMNRVFDVIDCISRLLLSFAEARKEKKDCYFGNF
jgi:hypothetical protein